MYIFPSFIIENQISILVGDEIQIENYLDTLMKNLEIRYILTY